MPELSQSSGEESGSIAKLLVLLLLRRLCVVYVYVCVIQYGGGETRLVLSTPVNFPVTIPLLKTRSQNIIDPPAALFFELWCWLSDSSHSALCATRD